MTLNALIYFNNEKNQRKSAESAESAADKK